MSHVEIRERTLSLPGLGVQTRVLDAGSGPTVLMLHGNPDNADEWRPLIERIAPGHRCIAPDFPGYGRSALPASFDYSLAAQVRFVDAVLEAAEAPAPVTLVVHDTGGMSGTAWAASNLAKLRGVVFTNTVAFEGFPWFPIARLWGSDTRLGRWRASVGMAALGSWRGALFRRIFAATSPQLSRAEIDRFVTSFAMNPVAKRTALRQFRQFMRPEFFTGFEEMRLRLVEQVPCRVLWGEHDPFIGASYAKRFGSAQVTMVPDAGHWVPIVAADQLSKEVAAIG